jgi:hypothetical protein
MGEKLIRKLHDEFGHIGSKQLSIMLKKIFIFVTCIGLLKKFVASAKYV